MMGAEWELDSQGNKSYSSIAKANTLFIRQDCLASPRARTATSLLSVNFILCM